ncbi:hypothetical protein U9R90_07890 [Streptomyces sp. E11-3]|uniref:hypothetical protein n=1 Tax=Streptomyces sp. E11-3 TaxID=3110112 RepID=UPI00398142CB
MSLFDCAYGRCDGHRDWKEFHKVWNVELTRAVAEHATAAVVEELVADVLSADLAEAIT